MVTRWFSQRPVLVLRHTALCRGHVRRQSTGLTNILATDIPPPVQVDSVTQGGVKLADGLVLPSACIFLDGKVFLWDVPSSLWTGWSMDHFEIFKIVDPRPEILLFGTGLKTSRPPSFIRDHMSALGIQLDVMDTRNACSTYNLLAEEGRRVGAALLPLKSRPWSKGLR